MEAGRAREEVADAERVHLGVLVARAAVAQRALEQRREQQRPRVAHRPPRARERREGAEEAVGDVRHHRHAERLVLVDVAQQVERVDAAAPLRLSLRFAALFALLVGGARERPAERDADHRAAAFGEVVLGVEHGKDGERQPGRAAEEGGGAARRRREQLVEPRGGERGELARVAREEALAHEGEAGRRLLDRAVVPRREQCAHERSPRRVHLVAVEERVAVRTVAGGGARRLRLPAAAPSKAARGNGSPTWTAWPTRSDASLIASQQSTTSSFPSPACSSASRAVVAADGEADVGDRAAAAVGEADAGEARRVGALPVGVGARLEALGRRVGDDPQRELRHARAADEERRQPPPQRGAPRRAAGGAGGVEVLEHEAEHDERSMECRLVGRRRHVERPRLDARVQHREQAADEGLRRVDRVVERRRGGGRGGRRVNVGP